MRPALDPASAVVGRSSRLSVSPFPKPEPLRLSVVRDSQHHADGLTRHQLIAGRGYMGQRHIGGQEIFSRARRIAQHNARAKHAYPTQGPRTLNAGHRTRHKSATYIRESLTGSIQFYEPNAACAGCPRARWQDRPTGDCRDSPGGKNTPR